MEGHVVWEATVESEASSHCRICVTDKNADCYLHEPIDDGSSSTLQMALEKMFPTIFNAEQIEQDFTFSWPSKICKKCKQQVQEAYDLYQICIDSTDRLRKHLMPDSHENSIPLVADCVIDVPMQEFVECDLIAETEQDPVNTVKGTRKSSRKQPSVQTHIKKEAEPVVDEPQVIFFADDHSEEDETEMPDEQCSSKDDEWKVPTQRGRKANSTTKKKTAFPRGRRIGMKNERSEDIVQKASNKKPDRMEPLESKIDVYRCQLCEGPTYGSPTELTEHLKEQHPQQIRSCDKCPKVFSSEQTFQHHQYCHATGRSHFCVFCDKGFQTEHLLKCHIRSHTSEAKFLCSYCGKGFASNGSLRQHVKNHDDKMSWACSLCPCWFNTKELLHVHQRTHKKNKIYSCETCGSQFNKHYSMVKHQIIHTGERPFVCELCPMSFVSPYHVKRHMLTHTGEKPYKCTYCDRGFAQSNVLVKHMKVHVGDNPYQCDRCDSSFRLLKDLRSHYKEHYQPDDKGITNSVNMDNKDIRFTSTKILKLRFQKDLAQSIQKCEEISGE